MWKVNYHIDFILSDGQKITKNNSLIIKSLKITSTSEAEKYVLKKYKNGFQPMVNKDDIFITIKNEKFIIDYIKKIS
tara:strand:- start:1438 stop:1668 length:231 start_codon:yes stop_codon:yes gene_type:complete